MKEIKTIVLLVLLSVYIGLLDLFSIVLGGSGRFVMLLADFGRSEIVRVNSILDKLE